MKPAPALDCAVCHRTIGKAGGHYLTVEKHVVCGRCLTRPAHAALYPACPEKWHDTLDHLDSTGTRAGTAWALGLWP